IRRKATAEGKAQSYMIITQSHNHPRSFYIHRSCFLTGTTKDFQAALGFKIQKGKYILKL
ncbi:MAG: hypothetical protein ACRDF4_02035, partial [Rhabdochlamydiaceae bacterium]